MKKNYKYSLLYLVAFFLLASSSIAQNNFFSDAKQNELAALKSNREILPQKLRTLKLNNASLLNFIKSLPSELNVNRQTAPIIELPMPDGSTAKFHVWQSSVVEARLAAKYPEIITFAGRGITDAYATLRMDYNPYFGFSAQILTPNGNVYIDPYIKGNTSFVMSYFTKDSKRNEPFKCNVLEVPGVLAKINTTLQAGPCRGTQLYAYRLALACTGEYATAVCKPLTATKPLTLAAMITSVNRVDGVYETELAVRLLLIANDDTLIYLNKNTDPYTNNSSSAMLNENQTNIDKVIGSANYDMGHAFSTGAGGQAFLGVVCTNNVKARGVTGIPNPVGDDFDIDYVAHEMGHQFGANHSFNSTVSSCGGGNRNAATAYEPGGGTTIMCYAGICGSDDIQPHSDPYFHSISFDEISNYLQSGATCKQVINLSNALPVITAMDNNGANIPLNTPFTLTGSATDADGDALTYSWEEWDLGAAGAWNSGANNATAPMFKARIPKTNSNRTFPDIDVILAGYPPNPPSQMDGLKGEVLPKVARTIKFRLEVRDGKGGVVTGGNGCQSSFTDTFKIKAITSTGPFKVTSPNGGQKYTAGTNKKITWDVAGTGAGTTINCAKVKILLSADGGLTFPIVLKESADNDGSATVTIPSNPTTQARIKVKAAGNIFFDISDTNFTIKAAGKPEQLVTGSKLSNALSVYPNPVHDVLNVSNINIHAGTVLKITDVYGRTVFTKKAAAANEQINVSRLAAGSYLISVIDGNDVVGSVQFVKN